MTPLVAVPSLDDVAADPSHAASLPAPVALALYTRGLVALAALAPALAAGASEARTRSAAPPAEDLLDIKAAARRLGVSPSWLYRRARALPFTVRVGGRLRFDPRGIARYVAERAGAGA